MKKTLKHPKVNDEARLAFKKKIAHDELEGKTVIYLDESGFAKDMPRTHGDSPKGKRCYGSHDWQAKGRTNALGAIVGFTFLTLALFDSTINSDVFYAWLTQDLLPKVTKGAVIVMDHAAFHKRQDIITAIEDHECTLEFLPPYSPDLNPMEHKWAQAKAMRKQHLCSVDELFSLYFQ